MMGYTVVEIVILQQGVSWIEALYFALGVVISGLAEYVWMLEHPSHLL